MPKKLQKPIIETTGKIEDEEIKPVPAVVPHAPILPKRIPRTLEETWGGFNEMSRYGTMDENEYKSKIRIMSRTDLESHARQLGIVIVESTSRLQDRLINTFQNYVATVKGPTDLVTGADTGKPVITDEIKNILAEGR